MHSLKFVRIVTVLTTSFRYQAAPTQRTIKTLENRKKKNSCPSIWVAGKRYISAKKLHFSHTRKLHISIQIEKRLIELHVWNIELYDGETRVINQTEREPLKALEMYKRNKLDKAQMQP